MKTATKFLSMLLLVAMCLSLMGGSAYALELPSSDPAGESLFLDLPTEDNFTAQQVTDGSDLVIGGTESLKENANTLDLVPLDEPSLLTAEKYIWNGAYTDLYTAAQNTTNIKLHEMAGDASGNVTDPGPGGIINKNVIIDLNGKTLTLREALTVNANIIIQNGTLTNPDMIIVSKGYKVSQGEKLTLGGAGKFGGEGSTEVVESYIATIGSEKFANMVQAFDYASKQSGTVTINMVNDTSILGDYPIGNLPTPMSCSAIILNLNNNCLYSDTGVTLPVPFTINGGSFRGAIEVKDANLTLNNTEITGGIRVTGRALTVNSSEVDQIELCGGTLNMGSGSEIGALVVDDSAGGQSVLNVSGGVVDAFGYVTGNAYRAITGGEWSVQGDADALEYLKNCVKDGLTLKGTSDPYTVGNGSGSGDSGVVTGEFTVYGSPYTKGSGNTVYVMMPYTSSNGNYYWSTTRNISEGNRPQAIASAYCSVTSTGSQYRLTLGNGFLDSLSAGTIYLWTGHDGKYTYMGSLTITGSSTPIIPGTASVWPVDDTWYSGTGMFYFYVTPDLQLVDGVQYDYYDVVIDGMQIGGDKISYNGYQKFGIAASVMDTLATGYHKIEVRTTAGWATGSFRVGATLRAVDTDKHVTGSSRNLQFVCSDSISRVWVGNNELTSYNYSDYWTLSSSGKTVTLTPKFLNSQLVAGNTYTITVQTANGDRPSCNFQILTTAQASSSPRTGDESNLALWAALLVLAGGATVAILPRLKKHEN